MARKRLVILGTGWAAFSTVKHLDFGAYDVTVISPRNHFLFTPLLPSTTVGTIEFRSIIEPIRSHRRDLHFHQAYAVALDAGRKVLECRNAFDGSSFEISYDLLLIGVGAVSHTFGIEGVKEHATFLKELADARAIRQRIIDNFERAATPQLETEEVLRLLHFVVVGGGPTGVEFAAELADFLDDELAGVYPELVGKVRITLIEARKNILGAFDEKLSKYAFKLFERRRMSVLVKTAVSKVQEKSVVLADGTELKCGLVVWSTGNGPTEFVKSLPFEKDRASRILTDGWFRLPGHSEIYAMGDCATPNGQSLPATSQVAMQEGAFLAKHFNILASGKARAEDLPEFRYHHLGMLAYVGRKRALADLSFAKWSGLATWIFWRSAYLTRLVSMKNKVLVLFDWAKAKVFGRDVSRF